MSRLYDYDEGCILIDGYDIKRVSPASLFSKIAIVFQEVTLFNTSILENIRIGNSQASDEEVKKAARLANCENYLTVIIHWSEKTEVHFLEESDNAYP